MRTICSVDIRASANDVWAVLVDVDAWVSMIPAITRIEREGDAQVFGPGFRWRETRVMMGREETQVLYVTRADPLARIDVEADAHGAHYLSVFTLTEEGEGCRLNFSFGAEPQTPFARVMAKLTGWLALPMVRKMLREDLDAIRAAAEARTEGRT